MRQILNQSLQRLQIYISTPKGPKVYGLGPKESIVVPQSYLSEQIKKLQSRRLIKISNYS